MGGVQLRCGGVASSDQVKAAEYVLRVRSGSASLTDVDKWIKKRPAQRALIWDWAVRRYGGGDVRLGAKRVGDDRADGDDHRGLGGDRGVGNSGVTKCST